MPTITVNGQDKNYDVGTTVQQVLESFDLRPEVIAVELNGALLRREDYPSIAVSEGDLLEYLYYMAGGESRPQPEVITKRVRFNFPMTSVKEPVIYRLVKEFDLMPNIRRANIEAHRGWVILEISGTKENLEKGFAFVRSFGVDIEPIEGDLVEG